MRTLLTFLFLFSCLTPLSARAQLVADDAVATAGVPLQVHLPDAADTLHVTYRPGSRLAATEALPTHGRTTMTWTPPEAGLVRLSVAGGPAQNVAVRTAETPRSGVLVLLLAGSLLAGGAILTARNLTARHKDHP